MKKAMVDIMKSGVQAILGVPLLTVHDELDLSRPQTPEGEEAVKFVQHVMETCLELRVPLRADRKSGDSWGDCVG